MCIVAFLLCKSRFGKDQGCYFSKCNKGHLRQLEWEEHSSRWQNCSAVGIRLGSHTEDGYTCATFFKAKGSFLGLLCFHTNCQLFCSSSVKNVIGNLIGIALNL